MGQILHGSATTTEAVRRAIQHSQESLRGLAKRYGVNPKTVAKWKARSSVSDLPTGPKQPRSTVLSAEEEAVVVDDQSRTGGSVGERNLPAMRERNVARDRQAEPRAAGLAVARGFEPLKGLERPLEQFRGNPGSFVGDNDDPVARVLAKRDARCAAIAHG